MDTFHFSTSWQKGVDTLFGYLPQLIGALVLLIIGYFVALIIKTVVRKILTRLRFDRALHVSPAGKYISNIVESPSKLVAGIAFWVIFLLFISLAVTALNIPALNAIVVGIYAYIPKIIAAMIIFLVASAITAGAEKFIQRVLGNGPTAKLIGAILPAITMSIAIFMILSELQIAKDIVNITYTAILGALALGLALAFGLGGRDVAADILGKAYDTTLRNQGRIKETAQQARNNAREQK